MKNLATPFFDGYGEESAFEMESGVFSQFVP